MADTKITGLQTPGAFPVVPSTDVLPIVIVADNNMAASGSTRKVTVNQILSAGGTATLASATITGDLTVDTSTLKVDSANNRVGINNASPAQALDVAGSVYLSTNATYLYGKTSGGLATRTFGINAANDVYVGSIDQSISNIRFNSGGGDWAVLNSTGLGVGNSSPAAALDLTNTGVTAFREIRIENSAVRTFLGVEGSSGRFVGSAANNAYFGCTGAFGLEFATNNNVRMVVDSSGNVGIGVASPSNRLETQESGTGSGLGGIVSSTATVGGNAGYVFRTGGTNRWSLSLTGSAGAESIRFYDVNNSATRLLIDTSGNVISNVTGTAPALATNSQMVFNLTSNTNLRISVRGTDGTTRTANITLA